MTIHHSVVAPDQTLQASVDWKRLRSVNSPDAGHNRKHTMIAVGEYVDVFGNRTCDQVKAEWFVQDDFEIQRFRIDSVTLSAYWEVVQYTTPRVIPLRLAHNYNDLVIFNPTVRLQQHCVVEFNLNRLWPLEAQHVTNLPFLARSFFSTAAQGTDIYVQGALSYGPSYKDHSVKSAIILKFNLDSPQIKNGTRSTSMSQRKTKPRSLCVPRAIRSVLSSSQAI
ncbi:unnamed protein product [Aphanomyces euteiches]